MSYIDMLQDTAETYGGTYSELPIEIRMSLQAAYWRETPALEPFNQWNVSTERYVWQEQISDMVEQFRAGKAQSTAFFKAQHQFLESIMQHALCWTEKKVEDDYDAEVDKADFEREAPAPRSDFLDTREYNGGRL